MNSDYFKKFERGENLDGDYSNGQNLGTRTYSRTSRGAAYAHGNIDPLQRPLSNAILRGKYYGKFNNNDKNKVKDDDDDEEYIDSGDSQDDSWESNDITKTKIINKGNRKKLLNKNDKKKSAKRKKTDDDDDDDDYDDNYIPNHINNTCNNDSNYARSLNERYNNYETRGNTSRRNSNTGVVDLIDDANFQFTDYHFSDGDELVDSESDENKNNDNSIEKNKPDCKNREILNLKYKFVKFYIDISSGLLINKIKSSIYNLNSKSYYDEDRVYNDQYEIPHIPNNSFLLSRIRKVYLGKRKYCNNLIDNIVSIDFLKQFFIFDLMEDNDNEENIFDTMLDKTVNKTSNFDTNNEYDSSIQIKNKELIHFQDITSIAYGNIDNNNQFLAILIKETTELFNVVVGTGRCLDPNNINTELNPSKYILLISSENEIQKLSVFLRLSTSLKKKIKWISKENKKYLMVDSSLQFDQHTIRQSSENEMKQYIRSKKRKERNNSSDTIGTAAIIESPDDADIYCVYPIEEEAIDAITICKGDLKRLSPCIYLNDNLIDFAIKKMVFKLATFYLFLI
jgi:hypothetical protein